MMSSTGTGIVQQQMSSLDDADCLASEWEDALTSAAEECSFRQQALMWGGKGKGGRGKARQTIQPRDIVLSDVSLEYVSDTASGATGSRTLLENATLKFLHGKVYSIVGRNGCGKSTLLRRMASKKIPGFTSLHLKMMYIPQEVYGFNNLVGGDDEDDEEKEDSNGDNSDNHEAMTPLSVVLSHNVKNRVESNKAAEQTILQLENQIEELDLENDEDGEQSERMETLCNEISAIEDEMNANIGDSGSINGDVKDRALKVLDYFGITEEMQAIPMAKLSGGQKKKVFLACSLFCNLDLLLLDEPTNHLDMDGMVKLRGLIKTMTVQNTTVILVSHDVDLINSVATDTINFSDKKLTYYKGNYVNFLIDKKRKDLHMTRQQNTLDKQRDAMIKSMDKMKKQATSTASKKGSKKLSRVVSNRKKKLERHGLEKDSHGHRSTVQKANSGIRVGSINSLDASTRKKQSYKEILRRADLNVAPVPDKAVQFTFRTVSSRWGEPLISALNVGHGFREKYSDSDTECNSFKNSGSVTQMLGAKKKGYLFDSVDLCIDEGSRVCILGENSCGKTTLLKILAKQVENPLEGEVHHAHNVNIAYFDQHKADDLIDEGIIRFGSKINSISLLMKLYPKKSEEDVRSELVQFGLSHQQSSTYIQFLSGGERCRLCLAMMMLKDPHVMVMDEISNHLDPESVSALAYGLREWNGTTVLVSHDAHLIRLLECNCYILMEQLGKLRRLEGGIDAYLGYFSQS